MPPYLEEAAPASCVPGVRTKAASFSGSQSAHSGEANAHQSQCARTHAGSRALRAHVHAHARTHALQASCHQAHVHARARTRTHTRAHTLRKPLSQPRGSFAVTPALFSTSGCSPRCRIPFPSAEPRVSPVGDTQLRLLVPLGRNLTCSP